MEILKVISMLLPVLVALSGLGLYIHGMIIEPNFENGEYFTIAWIEYGTNQNLVHFEYVPDGGGKFFAAVGEVLRRVDYKAEINGKIDDKPLLFIGYVRNKTQLIEAGRFVITARERDCLLRGTPEERIAALTRIVEKSENTYNKSTVMIEHDGKVEYVTFNTTHFNAKRIFEVYENSYEQGELTYA